MQETITTDDRVFELEAKLEETRLKLRDLATMGAVIASILDIETILSVVMEMSIRTVEGEVGLIQLSEADRLASKVMWGIDDNSIKAMTYKDNLDISTYCFNNQTGIVIDNSEMGIDFGPTINCVLVLPIKARARCHGTIIIVNKTTGGIFSAEDKDNLEILVNYAAVAIENSILLKESLQKQKFEQELAIAKQIQETILPDEEIKIKGVDIGAFYRPAREVGGDYYDVMTFGDNEFLMVIGDVSNKGIPAAMVMSATAAIIRSELANSHEIKPAQIMANVNNILCDGIIKSREMFVTLFIARFSMAQKKVAFCNAGHLPPLFWDANNNKMIELKLGGTFVGQFPGINYAEGEVEIDYGDRIFAFTDGLTEAADVNGNLFGLERVKQVFMAEKDLPANRFCARVREWVDRFSNGAGEDTIDDFTLFEIRILPEGSNAQGI
jgi:sigma-B regulation protein RsbU (phosphoserine phosphatase)